MVGTACPQASQADERSNPSRELSSVEISQRNAPMNEFRFLRFTY